MWPKRQLECNYFAEAKVQHVLSWENITHVSGCHKVGTPSACGPFTGQAWAQGHGLVYLLPSHTASLPGEEEQQALHTPLAIGKNRDPGAGVLLPWQ